MARHSGGAMVALLSDIEVAVFATIIAVAPMAAFTCSGVSSSPTRSRSTRGRAMTDGPPGGVTPWPFVVVAQLATRTHITATATAAAGWRIPSPSPPFAELEQQVLCRRPDCPESAITLSPD